MLRLLLLIINTGLLLSLCGCSSTDSETEAASRTYQIDANDPNATTIYDATLTHAVASPIASSIITDPEERKRWSSNVDLQTGYHEYWVAPDVAMGQGSGTREDPWDLYSALSGSHDILPNSILWIKEGDYLSPLVSSLTAESPPPLWVIRLNGTQGNAIHIRPERGAKVRIDGGPYFAYPNPSSNVWLWDVEITSIAAAHTEGTYTFPKDDYRPQPDYHIPVDNQAATNDYSASKQWLLDHNSYERSALSMEGGADNHLVNTILHRLSTGIGSWKRCENNVIYGNVIYNNGYSSDERLHGPGIYAQNESGTTRYLHENIVAGNLSNPFQIYSRTNPEGIASAFNGIGNIVFGARKIHDGAAPYGARLDVMFGKSGGTDQLFRENYIYGHQLETQEYDATDLVFENNFAIYTDTGPCLACSGHGNVVENIPTTQRIHVRPNAYDPRRAHMIVINPDRDPVISVNLGNFARQGDTIAVYNAVDLTAASVPLLQGVYNGSYINLPMEGSSNPYWIDIAFNGSAPDNPADAATGDFNTVHREFWAFIVVKNP